MVRPTLDRNAWLARLPDAFSREQAAGLGLSDWALARLTNEGFLERPGRGLYTKQSSTSSDPDLLAIATRTSHATLCLRSALSHHGLSDDIPTQIDIAIPAGTRPPSLHLPVAWHRFDAATFTLGRENLPLGNNLTIGLFSPERCIVDAFRLRRLEGSELGNEALKRWLSQTGTRPETLLNLAKVFPGVQRPLRTALEILL